MFSDRPMTPPVEISCPDCSGQVFLKCAPLTHHQSGGTLPGLVQYCCVVCRTVFAPDALAVAARRAARISYLQQELHAAAATPPEPRPAPAAPAAPTAFQRRMHLQEAIEVKLAEQRTREEEEDSHP